MKKMFGLMIAAGLILAMITAGGADSNTISVWRLTMQAAISSLLIISGTHFVLRGDRA